jgi:hypothetical protein
MGAVAVDVMQEGLGAVGALKGVAPVGDLAAAVEQPVAISKARGPLGVARWIGQGTSPSKPSASDRVNSQAGRSVWRARLLPVL